MRRAQALGPNGAGPVCWRCHTAGLGAQASLSFHFCISGRSSSKILSPRVDVRIGHYAGEVLRQCLIWNIANTWELLARNTADITTSISALLDPCICTACIIEGMLARDIFRTHQILALMKEFKMQMIPLLYWRQGHTSSRGQYTFVRDLLFVCVCLWGRDVRERESNWEAGSSFLPLNT